MSKLSSANRHIRPLKSRLRDLALLGLAVGCFAAPTRADTSPTTMPDLAPQFGTPADLPITLSGSYLAGRLAGLEKDYSQAAAFFQEALNADQQNAMLLERTFILKLANGDIVEAEHYANELESRDIQNFLAHLTEGAAAILRGDYAEAVDVLGGPGNAGPLAQLSTEISKAWALFGAGDVDGALLAVDQLKGPEWFDGFKANHRALIAFAAGRTALALTEIEAAYNADQGAIRVADAYARILASAGQKEEAIQVLDDYDRLLNSHPLLTRTRVEIEAGTPQESLVSDPSTGMAEILLGLGSAIGRDGAEELSAAYLQLALHLDPNAEFAAVALGGLFERMNQQARAIEVLKLVPEGAALKRDAEIQIGLNFNALEDLESARAHLEALIQEDPTELEAIVSLGNILRSHKNFEEAEAAYSQAIGTLDTLEREHWILMYFRGICRERQDKWDAAEADFRKALELYPDQPLVLNYLGYSLVDQGLKLDEALDMIKKAVELRPSDGYIVDSLGWVYYRLGRYDEAVKELERAIELRPSDPVINDHLGDAYWRVGRRNEARFQWNHARDLEPEDDELPKILDKIANGLGDDITDEAKVNNQKNGG